MSAQPTEPGPRELIRPDDQVIHVGDQEAVVVQMAELRRLRALERQASPEAIEAAELEAELAEGAEVLARHDEWIAAGRPGAVPHDVFRKLLLGETAE